MPSGYPVAAYRSTAARLAKSAVKPGLSRGLQIVASEVGQSEAALLRVAANSNVAQVAETALMRSIKDYIARRAGARLGLMLGLRLGTRFIPILGWLLLALDLYLAYKAFRLYPHQFRLGDILPEHDRDRCSRSEGRSRCGRFAVHWWAGAGGGVSRRSAPVL